MSRKAWLMIFAAGVLAGLIMAFLGPFGPTTPSAAAQQAAKANPPRFQVSSFAYPGYVFPNSSEVKGGYGAYFVDTQTGDIWAVFGDAKPRRLGKLE
jgi:hypothetical protein